MHRDSIKVFEFEKLTLQKDERGRFLLASELAKLYDFNDRNGHKYFTGIRDGVKFKNYVGVIQIGGLTIEILPKTDREKSSDQDYLSWHRALLNMLKVCRFMSVTNLSEASLKRKYNSILDLYFELFLDDVEKLFHQGLIKNYRKNSSNVNALKGSINFAKNIQKNLIHQERFYTNHQIYDHEILINQILLDALKVLKTLSSNPSINDRIERVLINYPPIKHIRISSIHFESIKESRKTVAYNKAIQIARMILLNYSPDIRQGNENMLTLLFDMNKLWEEYIYRMLIRSADSNTKISFQNKKKFWEKRTIRPDLVISTKIGDEKETFVIDTKWKMLDASNPKPSDDDLKQMYSYNLYWDAKRSMLLYPNSNKSSEKFGSFWKGRSNPEENQCKVAFINVLNDNKQLDFNIGSYILKKLSENF
jgi:5-methylcytosine-specific restriction enzyme subunit McrC